MKHYLTFALVILFSIYLSAQCDLDFGTSVPQQFTYSYASGSDIVNGSSPGTNATSTQSFDIWDETTNSCASGGGVNDITFEFEIIHAFDQYSVDGIIDTYAGSTHDITQSSSGLRGNVPMGNSGANESSAGDVRGYSITIKFANHVNIEAQDLTVNLTSVNTAGTGHESNAVVFLDKSYTPYGTATYDGFYSGTSGPSNDNSCTAPAARTNSWSVSATGAHTASSTSNVTGSPDDCTASTGSNGANNDLDINPVTHAGLNNTDIIGGFVFTVYLEDIAASASSGANTSTSTQFTSTLNGVTIASAGLPIDLVDFNASRQNGAVMLNWTTLSETNNDYFDIEWSTDGVDFAGIGRIEGAGNSFVQNRYGFLHDHPAKGNNYYRLKQVDFDQSFSYSRIINEFFETGQDMVIYPKLARSQLIIQKEERQSTVTIYDLNGRIFFQREFDATSQLEIPVHDLSAGSYIIIVQDALQRHVDRFVKL